MMKSTMTLPNSLIGISSPYPTVASETITKYTESWNCKMFS